MGGGAGGSFITNNGATPSTLTVNQGTDFTYSGIIKDGTSTVTLTKAGTATLILSGAEYLQRRDHDFRWHAPAFRFAHRHPLSP
ncbi:MAG: hypothetical protein WDN28_15130 [Chthoniobacter sp.]